MKTMLVAMAFVLAMSVGVAVQMPQFDVASIKPASENAAGSGMRTLVRT
jgi:hypothetical protein